MFGLCVTNYPTMDNSYKENKPVDLILPNILPQYTLMIAKQ